MQSTMTSMSSKTKFALVNVSLDDENAQSFDIEVFTKQKYVGVNASMGYSCMSNFDLKTALQKVTDSSGIVRISNEEVHIPPNLLPFLFQASIFDSIFPSKDLCDDSEYSLTIFVPVDDEDKYYLTPQFVIHTSMEDPYKHQFVVKNVLKYDSNYLYFGETVSKYIRNKKAGYWHYY